MVTFVVRVQDENGFTYEQEVGRCLFEVKNGMISGSEESVSNTEILVR